MQTFKILPKLKAGDKVAIVSPSAGLPFVFPWVYELGLKRIKDNFLIEPVEFPTARQSPEYLEANPQVRANDINAAFADKSIKAVIATIGGNDQIRILPFLDAKVIAANPKPFFGYSDCTNLHLFLWNLGIVSYYGGSVMSQFAMQGAMHEYTIKAIKLALFSNGFTEMQTSPIWTDFDLDWADQNTLLKQRPMYESSGWDWHNNQGERVTGRLWGGCLEILDFHLSVKRYLPNVEKLSDAILYMETSEEMPNEGMVYRFIAALGELGILSKFKAILVGCPKAQFCGAIPPEGREQFKTNQQNAIKKALSDYQVKPLVVFNLNFGHTDPQMIIPNGGRGIIDGRSKTISFEY